jgi:hypothetical protein
MDSKKRERLEAKGWKIGDAADFLELTPEESAIVEMRLALYFSLHSTLPKNCRVKLSEALSLTRTPYAD